MGVTADVAVRLMGLPLWRGVTRFESRNNPIGGDARVWAPLFAGLASLSAVAGQVGTTEAAESITSGIGAACRELDLSHNPLHLGRFRWPAESEARPRCLRFRRCNLLPPAITDLVRSSAWPGLVELDLRGNALYSGGLVRLTAADPPPDLVALVLEAGVAGTAPGKRLREKYGDAVVFSDAE